jgi:hypothetical protein
MGQIDRRKSHWDVLDHVSRALYAAHGEDDPPAGTRDANPWNDGSTRGRVRVIAVGRMKRSVRLGLARLHTETTPNYSTWYADDHLRSPTEMHFMESTRELS